MATKAKKDNELVEGAESTEETKAPKATKAKIHPALSFYEKWDVSVKNLGQTADKKQRSYEFLAVKKVKDNVKLTANEAADLNLQSHNNSARYYAAGTVTNGDTETITVNE